jgi:hypothetical protein
MRPGQATKGVLDPARISANDRLSRTKKRGNNIEKAALRDTCVAAGRLHTDRPQDLQLTVCVAAGVGRIALLQFDT